jgi:hypothetical protein
VDFWRGPGSCETVKRQTLACDSLQKKNGNDIVDFEDGSIGGERCPNNVREGNGQRHYGSNGNKVRKFCGSAIE